MATPFIAQIIIFGGNFAPRGWADCSGQLLPIAQNEALFALIGTSFGGDGQTTFALPDLRSRVPIHAGQGPGLTNRTLGDIGGAESVILTVNQIPRHNHVLAASKAGGNSVSPQNAVISTDPGGASAGFSTAGTTNVSLRAGVVSQAGGNVPHNNISPYLAIRYIIALEGIFPSQN